MTKMDTAGTTAVRDVIAEIDALHRKSEESAASEIIGLPQAVADFQAFWNSVDEAWPAIYARLQAAEAVCEWVDSLRDGGWLHSDYCPLTAHVVPESAECDIHCQLFSLLELATAWRRVRDQGGGA